MCILQGVDWSKRLLQHYKIITNLTLYIVLAWKFRMLCIARGDMVVIGCDIDENVKAGKIRAKSFDILKCSQY